MLFSLFLMGWITRAQMAYLDFFQAYFALPLLLIIRRNENIFESSQEENCRMEYDRDPSGWWLKVIGERVSAIKKRFRVIFYSISWFLLALTPGDSLWARLREFIKICTVCVLAGLWEQWTHKSHKMKMNRSTKFHVLIEASAPFRLSSGHTNYFIFCCCLLLFSAVASCVDRVIRLWMRSREAW